jgi:PKD repeat protein
VVARVRVLVVLLISVGVSGWALGLTGSAVGGASCSPVPTLQRVNAHFAGDPNQYTVQLAGTCAAIIGKPLYYFSLTTPTGKKIVGVNSDSNPSLPPKCNGTGCQPAPGCSSLGSSGAASVTCNAEYNEPDGVICAQFALGPGAVTGDQFSVQLLDSNFNPIPGTSSTQALPANPVAQCTGAPSPGPSPKPKPSGFSCSGPQLKLFDSSNTLGVLNGATPPTFSTKGTAYCVTSITTYHWNNGQGARPGKIGLGVISGLGGAGRVLGPFKATGSAGQGSAPNVNWTANIPSGTKPVVINGTYTCRDSDPKTWAQNTASRGHGFCIVYVTRALGSGTPPKGKKKPTKPVKKPAKPTKPTKPTKAKCSKGKLSIKASPDTGKPPLVVTFALCSPKVVQWRIDYGDGQSKVAIGSPPSSISHTYKFDGDFRPTLTVLASPTAPTATSASTSVSVHLAQLISLGANPPAGPAPLRVSFALGTTVKNITTWSVDFGDGQHTGGGGKPPVSVVHTYAKDGDYRVTFAVKPGSGNAVVATFAQVTVGAGTPPTLSLTASPTSGAHPLSVRFTTSVNIPGQIVSWQLRFGDGQTAGGPGKPPSTVLHTYSRRGTFGALLIVAQQQQYGGVQYIVPRGGLGITVG